MKIEKLKLTNFRNFNKLELNFENLNVIFGPNASGKSTVLEAIHLLSTAKSERAQYDKDMIQRGKEFAKIEAGITRDEENIKLELNIVASERYQNLARKLVKVNGVSKTLINFAGNLNSVLFTPSDLELITNGPVLRRRYLDSVLSQVSEEYRHSHTNFTKIIKQRNKLLERINEEGKGQSELYFWNESLMKEGNIIHKHRQEFFDYIKNLLSRYGKKLHKDGGDLTEYYKKSEVTKERLEEYKTREIAAKNTLIGPNRDDFSLLLSGMDLQSFGSRGEQRMAVLVLKLCEMDFIYNSVHIRPVLLLDDIFSELDAAHKKRIFEVTALQQTIITTTDLAVIKENLKDPSIINL
ncbi:hypothetical protein A2716_01890 [candidate division WWE3 bacterium RIFCSPHIGHO2_01_FULL_40_23]|uniref:DNA replication and repair protein RecF n=1 Tax=candidate division WWE3 bacterium RIFCSPLOWO2_01_FULL_41_18 TaxID=1802625 RepID=A0A1F4VER1_UNCKA|nr:MAG: hypothetical protein A2716_01890 [candidate division WWE3 bacterium RIFCSPHIGHO2_01_FULL_40_23]OGC55741.1 MAG: hypothetical protein A3A78_01740 [candidate division WWE3 bacterium RIFCSPLOWO2_01_FULL_41_18]